MGNDTIESDPLTNPAFTDIVNKGYPPEWIPIIVISCILLVIITGLDLKVIQTHKKYSIKHTLQFLCTIGILQIYPLFSLMYIAGMIVPKSLSTCTFIAETYEAISFLFFLRLMLTYMGGKKVTKAALKGEKAHLNVPPICCCICLPHITFSKTFFVINELFIVQFVFLQIVMGFVELMMSLDASTSHPAELVEGMFSKVYHATLIVSLLVSIYGLSGIYHAAEKELQHHNIFKKFISYKILVTLAKIQDVFVSLMAKYDGFGDISSGAFSSELRAHLWSSLLVVLECFIVFLFAIHYYNPGDYPSAPEGGWSPMKKILGKAPPPAPLRNTSASPDEIDVEVEEEPPGLKDISSDV